MSTETITLSHRDRSFERMSLYVTGNSYLNCHFRHCTMIVRELPLSPAFQNCRFDSCIWDISMNIRDRDAWQYFLDQIAPAIMRSLAEK
jgi:hypothetical protein